jgi:putative NADH-flavin reductase
VVDLFKDILGTELNEQHLREVLEKAGEILDAIRKLRSLDLTEVHPAVVYDPLLASRGDAG